jgi:thiamine biosynthesis lipoprotein
MGLPVSVALRGPRSPHEDETWAEAVAVLHEVDAVFSTYRDDSVISRLSRGDLVLEDCPDVVHEVLALGEQARVKSHGAFDVWRPGPDGTPRLDPSAVVKGWAVERAARLLERLVDTDFCLSAGGDMVVRTRTVDAPAWRIGVEDPADRSRVLAVVPVRNGAVATSGSAARGAHIVDARTGATPDALASVTIVGPDLVWADIDATTAFALGDEALAWLVERGHHGVLVTADLTRTVF